MNKNSVNVFVFAISFFSLLFANLYAEETSEQTLDQFSSLIGHWRGEGLGGVCEETWLPESAGIMLGTFKLMQNRQVNFFEILSLSIDSIGPAIRVKHFNADMTAWEDKADMVTFRYDSTANDKFYFDGLTFNMSKPDSMIIGVTFKMSDGSRSEKFINCKRVEIK